LKTATGIPVRAFKVRGAAIRVYDGPRELTLENASIGAGVLDIGPEDIGDRVRVTAGHDTIEIRLVTSAGPGSPDGSVYQFEQGRLVEMRTLSGDDVLSTSRYSWGAEPRVPVPEDAQPGIDLQC
jgi:hypothetical protein